MCVVFSVGDDLMNRIVGIVGFFAFVGFFVFDLYNIINGYTTFIKHEVGNYYYIWLAFDIVMIFWFYRSIGK